MNYSSILRYTISKQISILLLTGICVLFTGATHAADLQCNLATNNQIDPAIITTMLQAANKGHLYRVDARASNVEFQVNHFPFSSVEGHFDDFQGGLTLPAEADQSRQALFVIKVDSMTTGDDDLDDYLKSSVFFDATKFPEIIYISTGFEWIDESTARLYGELTLRGTTRPIIFIAHIDNHEYQNVAENQKMLMVASAELQRSEFGMQEMQLFISDTVRFNIKIEASRVGI